MPDDRSVPVRRGTPSRPPRLSLTKFLRRRRFRGQALVELALMLPLLMVLLLGAIDLGRAWQSQITIENAAREGAMEATFSPTSYQAGQPCDGPEDEAIGSTGNRVMCRIINETADSAVTVAPTDVTMTCSAACAPGTVGAPNTVTVRVEGHFTLLTPLMSILTGDSDITLAGTATATIAAPPTTGALGTPTPLPSPSLTPSPNPSASASPTPSPTPIPSCLPPVASFTVSPTSGVKNSTVFRFTDTSTNLTLPPGCNPIWSWTFGDGSGVSSLQNPTYVYTKKGDYTVSLVVSNSAGVSSPTTVEIEVRNN
jgi:Flp pilus assembly protein TadG